MKEYRVDVIERKMWDDDDIWVFPKEPEVGQIYIFAIPYAPPAYMVKDVRDDLVIMTMDYGSMMSGLELPHEEEWVYHKEDKYDYCK